ncbi:MAG: hypothetical protein ABSD21_04060 [Rhizomicrobium sp.]|jgi:hypothetical protein
MSTILEVSKLEIAAEYLDAAMQMYLERRNYFCAIHLAAAAAELFDRHLPPEKSGHEISWRAQEILHEREKRVKPQREEVKNVLYGTKNAIKHMDDGVQTVTVDPIFEARWYIDQALNSAEKLSLRKSPMMWQYRDRRSAEMAAP